MSRRFIFGFAIVAVAACSGSEEPSTPTTVRDAGTTIVPTRDGGVTADHDGGPNVDRDGGVGRDAGHPPVSLGPCEAPSPLPADPLAQTQQYRLPRMGAPVHMVDVDPDPDTNNLYMVGTGGLYTLTMGGGGWVSRSTLVEPWTGQGSSGGRQVAFAKLEPIGGGYVALTNRELGVSIVDVTNAASPSTVRSIPLLNASGMAIVGTDLLVLTHTSEIVTLDVSTPANTSEVARTGGLGNPWEIVREGDRAYVADNTLGLLVLDVSNPRAPRLIHTVPTAGNAQDVDYENGLVFVAVGGAGIQIFDATGPDAPVPAGLVDYGAAVVAVSAASDVVWGTTHEGVVAANVTDPLAPVPLAMQSTEQWAMNVWASAPGTAVIADWEELLVMTLDTAARSPEADVERSELYFLDEPNPDGSPTIATLQITNRGGANLEIVGAEIADPRFTIELDRQAVVPGDAMTFTIGFADDGAAVNGELCIATNDPDDPIQRIGLVETSNTNTNTGEPAPDFDLPSIDDPNDRYRLSDQLGHPVVLAYFATW